MGPLAQVPGGIDVIANGLAASPLPWMLALSLAANVYLFRSREARDQKYDADIEAIRKSQLDDVRSEGEARQNLLMQILPLSARLVEAVELVARTKGGQ